ncbi:hypothetical protein EJB05_04507 [Eragrostis curvula]|uniref:PHD-type domain-containing protein n=1 Tax=Eragrostis curvula TaxID=38414 RepID=A0A5J9WA41_9POAL|nr:hypothetical protein EJB05_04507 [Eragrostis curvula]
MGHSGSKATPMPGMEDGTGKDLKKDAASLEVNKSSVGGDEDLGGGPALTGKKRKDLMKGSVDENGTVTKRVLRSDSIKLRADADSPCAMAVEVSKSDCLERKHCEALVEADGSAVLTAINCNGEGGKEFVNVNASDVSEEPAGCAENNLEISGVAATELDPGSCLGIQGTAAELEDKSAKSDQKISAVTHTGSLTVDESKDNKAGHGGEVIDPSSITNDDVLSKSSCNPTSESEPVELEDAVVCAEGVVLHCGDQSGKCTVDNYSDLTELMNQEGRGIHVNEPKDASTSDIVFTRRKSISRKAGDEKQVKCEEESQVEKRVTRSATVKRREASESSCKTTKNEATVGSKKGDVIAHYTRKLSSTVSPKAHHTKLVERITSTKKQTVKRSAVDQRDSCVTGNGDRVTTVKLNSKSETLTEAAVPPVDQNISGSAITEKNDTEHTDSEGVKSENKTPVQKSLFSVGAKIVASKKRILESGLDKISGRSPVTMPSRKKTRNTPSDTELEQPNTSSGEEHAGKSRGSENRRVLRERQHRSQPDKSCRSSNRSTRNVCKLSHDESDDEETGSDSSYRKTRRRHRQGADPRVIKKEEDSSDSEEVITVRKTRRNRKDSEPKQRMGSQLKHCSGPSKTGRLGRPARTKSESSSLPQHTENEKVKTHEGEGKASILKPACPGEELNAGSRREEKQKISDQIKEILLNAGWTIDMRPRNGRNYMDSVYIPPVGKGSYWSVTKAYSAFLEGVGSEQKDMSKSQSSSKSSVSSPGKRHASSTEGCSLTEDILSKLEILKRNVVNKRRTKVEIQKLRKKKHVMLKKFKKSKGKLKEKKNKIERKKRGGCALLVRGSNKESGSSTDGFVPYEWKRTIFSWLIDLDILSVNSKLKCMDDSHSKILLEGTVTRDGINCTCCTKVLAVHEFVAHAGGEIKKSYRNIIVDQLDIDLLQCLVHAWDKQSDSERQAFFPISTEGDDPNDDTCGICGDGGNLICCDGCPSTFHMSCLGLEALPSDNWCCTNCSCKFCHEHSSNDAEDIATVDSSLLTCFQCEEKYHQACSHEIDSPTSDSDQSGNLFCQQSCRLLSEGLHNLLAVKKDVEPEYSCRIIQRIHEDVPETVLALDTRVECNSKIAVALSLMDECFLPIVDQRTGINLIRNVVYGCGSNFVRLDFRGFYIFVLERGDEIIAAASVRIHGTKLAEMPFIGTRNMYRRQGMCRRLLDGIEMILSSLNVEKLIIPAITELVDTWTSKFGFSPLEASHLQEVKSISMLVFPGTGLLQKPLLKKALPEEHPSS